MLELSVTLKSSTQNVMALSVLLEYAKIPSGAVENASIAANNEYAKTKMQPFHQPECQVRLEPGVTFSLDSSSFKTVPNALEPLPEGFVAIWPKAFGLNLRDVLVAILRLETIIWVLKAVVLLSNSDPAFRAASNWEPESVHGREDSRVPLSVCTQQALQQSPTT